jgi:hypothetical protein
VNLQFDYDFMFASLAARKFLEKYYSGESTFVDISDYAARIQLDQQQPVTSQSLKASKVETLQGGCLHLAISLTPEAHPLAEDRVATIALLGALDLPRPDSVKDKLKGMIQEVYYVIERGYSRTISQPQTDCEGSPQFFDQVGAEVFQASQSALVGFDQENSMITIRIHRKEPPKENESDDGEEEPEGEEEDDANDDLIAFCEFDLWDLVSIERGNQQVDLLDRITRTFDCLTPKNAVRVLTNEVHQSMVNVLGRGLIELRDLKKSVSEGSLDIKKDGILSNIMGKVKGAILEKAPAAQAAVDVASEVLDFFATNEDDVAEDPPEPDVVELQSRMLVAKKQLKRSIQSLRLVAGEHYSVFAKFDLSSFLASGGQSQDTCGNIICRDFLKQARATNFQYFQFWLQSFAKRPLDANQLLHSHYTEEDVNTVCHEATAKYMLVLKGCQEIFDSEMMLSLRPVLLKSLSTVKDKATEFGNLSHKSYKLTIEKHEELEKLCGEFDLNPQSFNSLSSLFGFWWRGAAPRFSHMAVITKEESNLQLLRYEQRARAGNPEKVAALELLIRKGSDKVKLLKTQVPDKCKEFCSVMLSVFGDAYSFDCALADSIHLDSRRAFELNDVLQGLNSDIRVFIPSRPPPPCLSYEAFVNCFGGLDTVNIGLEARSIAVMSQPLAAVSSHVIASVKQFDGRHSVSRHLLRLADQIANSDWAEWLASATLSPAIINKTSEAYMMNYAHMSGNLRAKAYSTFLQWSDTFKRLVPGKGYIEPPEFARMRPGESFEDDFESSVINVWSTKMVQAFKEVFEYALLCNARFSL